MEEFRQLEHGYVISPLSTLSTGRIPQEIARVSPAISQAKSRVAAKHSARRIRTPSVEMSAAILNISICGGDKVVRASFRVFCATMMAVAFCSMAAAETLVLEIADARGRAISAPAGRLWTSGSRHRRRNPSPLSRPRTSATSLSFVSTAGSLPLPSSANPSPAARCRSILARLPRKHSTRSPNSCASLARGSKLAASSARHSGSAIHSADSIAYRA